MVGVVDQKQELLRLYDLFPFHEHPLWRAIRRKQLTYEQVIEGEVQHWIRTRAGKILRENAMKLAERLSPAIFEQLTETYLEECTDHHEGPSHLKLIECLVVEGGKSVKDLPFHISLQREAMEWLLLEIPGGFQDQVDVPLIVDA